MLRLLLALQLSWPAATALGETGASGGEIRSGRVYVILEYQLELVLRDLSELRDRGSSISDEERRQEIRLEAERTELERLLRSLALAGDELRWLRQQSAFPAPLPADLRRHLQGAVPGLDQSRLFLARPGSAADRVLDGLTGANGATLPTNAPEGGNFALVADLLGLLTPHQRAQLDAIAGDRQRLYAQLRFENDLQTVRTALHEALHLTHALERSRRRARQLAPGREAEQDALRTVLEEGYTHRQTRQALPGLLRGAEGTPLGEELARSWEQYQAQDAGELARLDSLLEAFDARLAEHHYAAYEKAVAAIALAGGERPLQAFVVDGDQRPLLERAGKAGARALSRLCLIYMADDRPGPRAALRRAMQRVLADPRSAAEHARSAAAVWHFAGRFYQQQLLRAFPDPAARMSPAYSEALDAFLDDAEAQSAWDGWVADFRRRPARAFAAMDAYARGAAARAAAERSQPTR